MIFEEDIFFQPEVAKAVRKRDKRYSTKKKTDWNRIFERAVTALIIFSASYFIIHAVVYALGYYN